MDLLESAPCGPVFGSKQQHNLFPVVPSNQEYYKIFLKGHPKVLGAVQITLVLLHWSLGAVLLSSSYVNSATANSGIPYWASVIYLVSGGLCVTVELKPSLVLVKWTFAIIIISCLSTLVEFGLICDDLARVNNFVCPAWDSCYGFGYEFEVQRIALGFLLFVCMVQFGIFTYLLFFAKGALTENMNNTTQVYALNNEYKYFVSFDTSQPADENPNYFPVTLNIKTENVKI